MVDRVEAYLLVPLVLLLAGLNAHTFGPWAGASTVVCAALGWSLGRWSVSRARG